MPVLSADEEIGESNTFNSNFIAIFAQKLEWDMDDRIRIKDIAAKAGVSVGTVDRVLHKRPNVSKSARER